MTQTNEIQSVIIKAQSLGIDISALLSRRELQFVSGQFTPNMNYERRLRFSIRQKLKALQNGNALPNSVRAPEAGSLTMLTYAPMWALCHSGYLFKTTLPFGNVPTNFQPCNNYT
ncbi:MAG: hypothetical protein ACRD38_02340 [Nitrososphaerales archaeon]